MKYKRLGRSRRGLGSWRTLWLGDDHLLSVESTGYSEEYSRYYFKEIQALVTCRTATGKVWNAVFGALAFLALFGVVADYAARSHLTPKGITLASFCGFCLLLLAGNIFRGPTCRCTVLTPIGAKALPPLGRVRSVRKVLGTIRPLIAQLQGEIGRREITELARMAKAAPPVPSPPARDAGTNRPAAAPLDEAASSYNGAAHRAAFLLLVTNGGLAILPIFQNSKLLVSMTALAGFAFLILGIIALIKQKDFFVPSLAKGMTWGGIVTMLAGSVIGYFCMIFMSLTRLKRGVTARNDLLEHYAAIQPADHPAYASFLVVYAIAAACIAIVGLIALDGRRKITAGKQP